MGRQSDHAVNDNSVQKLVPVVLQSVPHNNMGTQSDHAVNDNSVQKLVPVVLQSVPHNNVGTQSHHAVNDKGLGGPAVRLRLESSRPGDPSPLSLIESYH